MLAAIAEPHHAPHEEIAGEPAVATDDAAVHLSVHAATEEEDAEDEDEEEEDEEDEERGGAAMEASGVDGEKGEGTNTDGNMRNRVEDGIRMEEEGRVMGKM